MTTIDEAQLFAVPEHNKVAVLLIDASGSVLQIFNNETTIFNKMKQVVKTLPHEKFRIIFWNSDNERDNNKFPDGVSVYPFVIEKNKIDSIFNLFSTYITNRCATYTHLGINALVDKCKNWFTTETTDVYIVTDGEMGYSNIASFNLNMLKTKLAESIKKLITSYKVNLSIYTVEAVKYDFNTEILQRFAGSDVYSVIKQSQLTNSVTKFVTFDLTNSESGYVHISRTNSIAGFIPYKDRLFSESKISMFLHWIKQVVSNLCNSSNDNEHISNELLKIVQDLTPTLSNLTLDKPLNISDQIINNFCNIFRSTPLDFYLVKFILEDSIKNERAGQAQLLSVYQQRRRDFYKLANELLQQSTSKYIGVLNYIVTFPLADIIVTGHKSLITESMKGYTNCAIKYHDYTLPIMPLDFEPGSDINEQCLRQWTRTVMSKLHKVDLLGDIIIYIVMMTNLRVQISNVSDNVKTAYKRLCTTMLSKKRLNSDTTELEKLLTGAFPTPNNGRVETFYDYMNSVKNKLGLQSDIKPMTMWAILIQAYGNNKLMDAQQSHCMEDIRSDYPDKDPSDLVSLIKPMIKPYTVVDIPLNIDYNCLISLEDCSDKGGYKFNSHKSTSNYICQPVNIISEESFEYLFNNTDRVPCPICYTDITHDTFTKVGPVIKNIESEVEFPVGTVNLFGPNIQPKIVKNQSTNQSVNQLTQFDLTKNVLSGPSAGQKKIWIQMIGTIGSGKTTLAKAIKKSIKDIGGHCIIVGIDKYCKKGMDFPTALNACRTAISQLNNSTNSLVVAIIDTCGEVKFNKKDTVFEIRLAGWTKLSFDPNCIRSNLEGYLHWSLRNVLKRTKDSNCLVNPDAVGIDRCIEIHISKSKGVFGKRTQGILFGNYTSVSDAITELNKLADKYQESIQTVEEQVKCVMKRIQ